MAAPTPPCEPAPPAGLRPGPPAAAAAAKLNHKPGIPPLGHCTLRLGYGCRLTPSGCASGDRELEALEDRICAAVGCAEEASEYFHVVRYAAGSSEQCEGSLLHTPHFLQVHGIQLLCVPPLPPHTHTTYCMSMASSCYMRARRYPPPDLP